MATDAHAVRCTKPRSPRRAGARARAALITSAALLIGGGALGCEDRPEPLRPATETAPPAELIELSAPEPEPEPAEPPPPDELLVIASTSCPDRNRWHGTRGSCVQTFRGLYHQGEGTPWAACATVRVPAPSHRLLLRGVVTTEAFEVEGLREQVRCVMTAPAESLLATEHDLYPVGNSASWDLSLTSTFEEHQERLGLEGEDWPAGVHTVVGGVSGLLHLVTRWLDELDGRLVSVRNPTMDLSEVLAHYEASFAEAEARTEAGRGRVDRIGRAELFSPEIDSRALRVAMARMPVLHGPAGKAVAFTGPGGTRRFLLIALGSMPGTYMSGTMRAAVRYRVLEEAARPYGFTDPRADGN